jgi:hypothetical protein
VHLHTPIYTYYVLQSVLDDVFSDLLSELFWSLLPDIPTLLDWFAHRSISFSPFPCIIPFFLHSFPLYYDDGASRLLRNVGKFLRGYTALHYSSGTWHGAASIFYIPHLFYPKNTGSRFLQNSSTHLPNHTSRLAVARTWHLTCALKHFLCESFEFLVVWLLTLWYILSSK